jgi:hypothetical protein
MLREQKKMLPNFLSDQGAVQPVWKENKEAGKGFLWFSFNSMMFGIGIFLLNSCFDVIYDLSSDSDEVLCVR